jgi:hypothetical protein
VRWLARHLEWLRYRSEALEALDEIADACALLRRTVDRPADREFLGRCACGESLFAVAGRDAVTCGACNTGYDLDGLWVRLLAEVGHLLLSAAEIARLAARYGAVPNQQRARHLINVWADRGVIAPHGHLDAEPVYPFAEVAWRVVRAVGTAARAS